METTFDLAGWARDGELAQLDLDIAGAWRDVIVARRKWAHSPSTANLNAEQEAEAYLNGLLERRFALHPTHPTG